MPIALPILDREEARIQEAIKAYLVDRGWYVMVTHGNMYQSGFPDLFVTHERYGTRWIEVKRPNMIGSKFTKRQNEVFPELIRHGCGIWILTSATKIEYDKLFGPSNYWQYTMR